MSPISRTVASIAVLSPSFPLVERRVNGSNSFKGRTRLLWRSRAALFSLAILTVPSLSTAQDALTPSPERASFVLRPGDRVRLKVWREPDLSGDFVIDEDGVVVFPKVGRVDVQKISTDSLKALLIARYAESLRNPSVEVTVLRKLNVLGAVKNPGLYYVDPTTTVADALALAGGVTPEGNQNRFELLRGDKRLTVELSHDSRLVDSPLQPGDQLRVPMRSWLSRNTGLLYAFITSAAVVLSAKIR